MLAELAACNAAYGIIKQVVLNGKELFDSGQACTDYFNNKSALQKKLSKAPNSKRNDMQEFFALEKLKAQEEELREVMIYSGRANLWDDWLKFQQEAKKQRVEAEREELRKKIAFQNDLVKIFNVFIGVTGVSVCIGGAIFIVVVIF